MSAPFWIIAAVAVQRLAELAYSRRNTARLLAVGGIEAGARHYPLVVAVHGLWLGTLLVTVPADAPLHMIPLGLYLLLQGVRYWVIRTLGENWTTRIIRVPGRALVQSGAYRYLRHPNYAVVVGEIALLPMVFGAWWTALVFSVANAAVLAHRIRIENQALEGDNFAGH